MAIALLKLTKDHSGPVVVEDESRLIGHCCLPACLFDKISTAPLVVLDVPVDERVEHILNEYVLSQLNETATAEVCAGLEQLSQNLFESLARIKKKLGPTRYQEIAQELMSALKAHKEHNNIGLHRVWIKKLLLHYYDPLYNHHLEKNRFRTVCTGSPTEVTKHSGRQPGIFTDLLQTQ